MESKIRELCKIPSLNQRKIRAETTSKIRELCKISELSTTRCELAFIMIDLMKIIHAQVRPAVADDWVLPLHAE